MALTQKDIPAPALQKSLKTDNSQNAEAEELSLMADADAQDEELWVSAFATSQNTLSLLAAQSRTHRDVKMP